MNIILAIGIANLVLLFITWYNMSVVTHKLGITWSLLCIIAREVNIEVVEVGGEDDEV